MQPTKSSIRFSLRTLLLATVLIGAGLGWYFRTQTIELRWPDGSPRARYTVRNGLRGEFRCAGHQMEWLSDGRFYRTANVQGVLLWELDEVDWRYLHRDGTPVDHEPPENVWRIKR